MARAPLDPPMAPLAALEPAEWPAQHEITDPAAIRLLTDMRALKYLTPFLIQAHTLSSAARALQCSPSTIAHWIPRFLGAGLLLHLGDQARAGMAMPIYRAPGRQLVVPYEALPFDRRVALLDGGRLRVMRRFLDGLDEAIERDRSMGLGFSSDSPKSFTIGDVETDARRLSRNYTDGWLTLELTDDDARQMSTELEALFRRFTGRNGPRRYIAHHGIAPDARFRWRSATDDLPD